MRTTREENALLGEEVGRKVAASTGPACILLPLQGVSAIDRAGQSFDDPAARTALYDGIRRTHGSVELLELEVANETPKNTNELADLSHTGYTFVTFLAENLDAVSQSCQNIGVEIIVEPKVFNRPFHEGKRAMMVRSIGGEYLEIIEL